MTPSQYEREVLKHVERLNRSVRRIADALDGPEDRRHLGHVKPLRTAVPPRVALCMNCDDELVEAGGRWRHRSTNPCHPASPIGEEQ